MLLRRQPKRLPCKQCRARANMETSNHQPELPADSFAAEPVFPRPREATDIVGAWEMIEVGRYHSWIISEDDFPKELEITARDDNNYIMGLQHKKYDIQGVQFHPESVLTPDGEKILRNWLKK